MARAATAQPLTPPSLNRAAAEPTSRPVTRTTRHRPAATYVRRSHGGVQRRAALRQLSNRLVGIRHGCLKTRSHCDETTGWNTTSRQVTACLAVGAVLILAAAFFSRISKVILPGGYELDLDTGAKLAAAVSAKASDPAEAAQLYKNAIPAAIQSAAQVKTVRLPNTTQSTRNTGALSDDQISQIVVDGLTP